MRETWRRSRRKPVRSWLGRLAFINFIYPGNKVRAVTWEPRCKAAFLGPSVRREKREKGRGRAAHFLVLSLFLRSEGKTAFWERTHLHLAPEHQEFYTPSYILSQFAPGFHCRLWRINSGKTFSLWSIRCLLLHKASFTWRREMLKNSFMFMHL